MTPILQAVENPRPAHLHWRDRVSVPVDVSGRVAGDEGEGDLDTHRQQVGPGEDVGLFLEGKKTASFTSGQSLASFEWRPTGLPSTRGKIGGNEMS